MTTTTTTPQTTRDSRALLGHAVAAITTRRRAEVDLLDAALAWAHAHPATAGQPTAAWTTDTPAVLWGEQAIPLAGPGAPVVAEFAPMELAAALDISHEAALALMGDALDLAHRLPRLWALVRDLIVPVHLARRAAQESRDLPVAAADHADRLLVWQPRRLNPHRVGVLVHEARLYADPDRAAADHDAALADRRVDVHHELGAPGTSAVFMTLDTGDAVAFDRTVSTIAATMSALGHPAPLGARRAHAVGLLADPQKALDLLAVDPADPDRPDPDTDPAICVAEDAAYARSNPFAGHGRNGGRAAARARSVGGAGTGSADAVIVFHVTAHDLRPTGTDGTYRPGRGGVARSAKLGPVTLDRLAGWLAGAANVTIRPVLDPTTIPAVDSHDPPPRMAEAVRYRDTTCVYPRCNRAPERCDLDHIDPYVPLADGGPPGQTHPANLAPLCRRHHRAKTFGGFSYHRRPDGSYQWTLPTGARVTTDPAALRPLPKAPSDRSPAAGTPVPVPVPAPRQDPRPPC